MALSVNTNIPSQTAQLGLERSQEALETTMRRLSTGYRINSAKDDAAGLQISNRLSAQIDGLAVAVRNANDGISIAQTAEGAMGESTAILQRLRDLSLQSANDSNDTSDRLSLNRESKQLIAELDRISSTTTFGGQQLLDGSFINKHMQVGSNANEIISISVSSVQSGNLGIDEAVGVDFAGFQVPGASDPTDQTLTIGVNGEDSAIQVKTTDSAKLIAEKISSSVPDTIAKAKTKVEITFGGGSAPDEDVALSLSIGSQPTVSAQVKTAGATVANTDVTALASALKAQGIEASATDLVLTVEVADGDNLTLNAGGSSTAVTAAGEVKAYDGSTKTGEITDVKAGGTAHGAVQIATKKADNVYTLNATGNLLATPGTVVSGTVGSNVIQAASHVSNIDITTYEGAQSAIPVLDAAIADIDNERGTLGALQNRFQHTIYNLQSIRENVMSSRGRIKDTDYATEMSELTRQEVLKQASMTNLARANNMQKDVLYLLN